MASNRAENKRLADGQLLHRDRTVRTNIGVNVLRALLCVLIALGCFINLDIVSDSRGSFFSFLSALPGNGELPGIICFAIVVYFGSLFCSKNRTWQNHKLAKFIVSQFFAITMVFGWAFSFQDSAYILFSGGVQSCKSLYSLGAWFCVSYLCLSAVSEIFPLFYQRLHNASVRALPPKVGFLFKAHPFLCVGIVLNIVWFPALIGYLPGLFTWDTPQQIYMWYNMPNYHSSLLNLINPEITLSQHHPVLHTALLGLCVQLGQLFGNDSFGVFVFTFIQFESTIFVIAYSLNVLYRIGSPKALIIGILCFYALVPIFPLFADLTVKDSLFGVLLLAFETLCFSLAVNRESRCRDWAALISVAILLSLMRNGALLFALAGIASLVLTSPRYAKRGTLCAISVLVVVVSFSSILLPSLQVTPGSKREMLSIPFQQVARYVVEHPDEMSDKDAVAIDAILELDTLADRYDPNLSDKVKDQYNENATREEMQNFWLAWARLGATHPETYLSATANNYYGYFYLTDFDPELYTKEYSMECMAKMESFNIHEAENAFSDILGVFDMFYMNLIETLPLIKVVLAPPFYVWILIVLTFICITQRRREGVVLLTAPWLVLLVNLIGPANGYSYFRYTYPIALCIPFIFGIVLTLQRSKSKDGETAVR